MKVLNATGSKELLFAAGKADTIPTSAERN